MTDDPLEQLRLFRSVVDDPRQQPDPYALAMIAEDIRLFREGASKLGLDAGFVRAMSGLVIEVLRQVDALSRSDAFWEETNRRPTPSRLAEYCKKLLSGRPGDLQALWMAVAVSTVIGLGFAPRIWMKLMAAAHPEISWPIGAALCGEALGSYDTVRDLAAVLTGAGRIHEALPELERLKRTARTPDVENWAAKVIDELSQIA